jgi:hypothetical protein
LRHSLGLMLPVVGLRVSSSDCELSRNTVELCSVVIMQQQSGAIFWLLCKCQIKGWFLPRYRGSRR